MSLNVGQRLYGQSNILEVKREYWVFLTDYAIHQPGYERNFDVGFLVRAEWNIVESHDYEASFFNHVFWETNSVAKLYSFL